MLDIVFSFDTTGSMRPAIQQVRQVVDEVTQRLFHDIKGLRIGMVSHGDFYDGPNWLTKLNLTKDSNKVRDFVTNAPLTHGGDAAEAYETVLMNLWDYNWKQDRKVVVMIGDDVAHPVGYRYGKFETKVSWVDAVRGLSNQQVAVYPVQALGRTHATRFWNGIAEHSGTVKIDLPQFSDVVDTILAITYSQSGKLEEFTREVEKRASSSVLETLAKLAGKPLSKRGEKISGRFQVLDVPGDMSIRDFVTLNGLVFETGRGFYEFTKRETIQDYKEVVAQNIETGALITGKRARSVLGISQETGKFTPGSPTHRAFVQSTSVNRKLIGGTKFLYEISEVSGL